MDIVGKLKFSHFEKTSGDFPACYVYGAETVDGCK